MLYQNDGHTVLIHAFISLNFKHNRYVEFRCASLYRQALMNYNGFGGSKTTKKQIITAFINDRSIDINYKHTNLTQIKPNLQLNVRNKQLEHHLHGGHDQV